MLKKSQRDKNIAEVWILMMNDVREADFPPALELQLIHPVHLDTLSPHHLNPFVEQVVVLPYP